MATDAQFALELQRKFDAEMAGRREQQRKDAEMARRMAGRAARPAAAAAVPRTRKFQGDLSEADALRIAMAMSKSEQRHGQQHARQRHEDFAGRPTADIMQRVVTAEVVDEEVVVEGTGGAEIEVEKTPRSAIAGRGPARPVRPSVLAPSVVKRRGYRKSVVGIDCTPCAPKEGMLEKKGLVTMKRVFCKLRNSYLNYYRSVDDAIPAGSYNLQRLAAVRTLGRELELTFFDGTSKVLRAATAADAKQWERVVEERRRWFHDIDTAADSAAKSEAQLAAQRQRQAAAEAQVALARQASDEARQWGGLLFDDDGAQAAAAVAPPPAASGTVRSASWRSARRRQSVHASVCASLPPPPPHHGSAVSPAPAMSTLRERLRALSAAPVPPRAAAAAAFDPFAEPAPTPPPLPPADLLALGASSLDATFGVGNAGLAVGGRDGRDAAFDPFALYAAGGVQPAADWAAPAAAPAYIPPPHVAPSSGPTAARWEI